MGMFITGIRTSHNTFLYRKYMACSLGNFFLDHLPGARFSNHRRVSNPDEWTDPEYEGMEEECIHEAAGFRGAEPEELYPVYLETTDTGWSIAHFFRHTQKSISLLAGSATLLIMAGALFLCTYIIRTGKDW